MSYLAFRLCLRFVGNDFWAMRISFQIYSRFAMLLFQPTDLKNWEEKSQCWMKIWNLDNKQRIKKSHTKLRQTNGQQNCFFGPFNRLQSDGNFLVELFRCSSISVIPANKQTTKEVAQGIDKLIANWRGTMSINCKQPFAKWAIFIVCMVHMLLESFRFRFDFFVVLCFVATESIFTNLLGHNRERA